MTPIRLASAVLAVSSAIHPALADPAGLSLTQGDIFTNPVGTVMDVSVANGTASTVGSVTVACSFTAGGKPVGSASTTLYNITPATTGKERIQLMGAQADAASCSLSAPTPAAN